jgi:DNA polymerase III subunit beta
MQIVTQAGDLRKALSLVSTCASKKNTLPILSHVLITAADDRITLTCSNLDEHLTLGVPGTVKDPGVLTLEIADLRKALQRASGEFGITGIYGYNLVRIRRGSLLVTIPGTDGSEFPPAFDWGKVKKDETAPYVSQSVPVKSFLRCFEQTLFSTSSDEARPLLQGVKLDFQDHQITATSTNGFAAAIYTEPLPTDTIHYTIIVPREIVANLRKLFNHLNVQDVILETSVSPTNHVARITSPHGKLIYTFPVIEGTFPDVGVITKPRNGEFNLLIPTDQIMEYLGAIYQQSASPAYKDFNPSSRCVKVLVMQASEQVPHPCLGLYCHDESQSQIDTLGLVDFEGENIPDEFCASFWPELLYEGIRHALPLMIEHPLGENLHETLKVKLTMQSPTTPARIEPEYNQKYLYVLMPMHIDNPPTVSTFKPLLDLLIDKG